MSRRWCSGIGRAVPTPLRSVRRLWLAALLVAVGVLVSPAVGATSAPAALSVGPDTPPGSVRPTPSGFAGRNSAAGFGRGRRPRRLPPAPPAVRSGGARRPSRSGSSGRSGAKKASGGGPVATVVRTVPPVGGVTFVIGRRRFTTGRAGRVTLPLSRGVPLFSQVVVPDAQIARDVRTHFGQWYGSVKSKNVRATIGFRYRIGLAFDAPAGADLSKGAITLVRLASSTGQVLTLEGDQVSQGQWVDGTRVVSLGGGLESKDVQYSVSSALIRGANIVNRGAQRFTPSRDRVFRIKTLWYQARFSSRDLLFGSPIGSAVILTYPDGSREHIAFAGNAEVTVRALPRGSYTVSVEGAGTSFTRPLTLSKNQSVDLQMLSYLDVAVVFGALVLVAGGLLVFGRRRRWLHRFPLPRRVRSTVEAEAGKQ